IWRNSRAGEKGSGIMHELTVILSGPSNLPWDEVITSYMKQRAEWLRSRINHDQTLSDLIDQSFGIAKKTLEEKLKEGRYNFGTENPDLVEVNWAIKIVKQ